jgi:Ca-activated chloride channel family protein
VGRRLPVVLSLLGLLATACIPGSGGGQANGDAPKGCQTVQVTVSPEKFDLMTALAAEFNKSSDAKKAAAGACAFAKVKSESSGAGADALTAGWVNEAADGPKPTIWSPASAAWGAVVNQRLADAGQAPTVPANAESFMLTPLVIAMPRPMADAIGYPAKPFGFQELIALSQDPKGWGAFGHPEWGPFKLGKTSPKFSTSALSATIAQYYTAVKKTQGLTLEDVNRPDVADFNKKIEASVVHYGDTTLAFLNNWYRNDQRGTALTYVSAVAVEEKSVIDYNRGNPDGVLQQGEKPRPPKVPLVAMYPKDGTLFSDSPLFILDAPWVSAGQKEGAKAFQEFVKQPDKQKKVLEFGFRPANPAVAVADPIVAANGVDAGQPATTLGVPEPPVLSTIIKRWEEQRKGAQVLLVIDVSGSMGEPVENADGQTRLDLAKKAAVNALDQFGPNDLVGLRIFSTGINPQPPGDYLDLVPIGKITDVRETIKTKIRSLIPTKGTPLYSSAIASYQLLQQSYKPTLINAVVLLTDGKNEDEHNNDLQGTLQKLSAGSEGTAEKPVRLFTIAFGDQADLGTLTRLSEATDAKAYDSKDPNTIDRVFTSVISNF